MGTITVGKDIVIQAEHSCFYLNHDWIQLKSVLQRTRQDCLVYECQNIGCESVKVTFQ